MSTVAAPKGLEGIVATNSSICWIDGDTGVLSYRGIDIHELAQRSAFEETTYLLWFGRLPDAAELAEFSKKLSEARKAGRERDSNLLTEAAKFVKRFRPEMVLSENVQGIGDPKYGGVWDDFRVQLSKLGYATGSKVVCTSSIM